MTPEDSDQPPDRGTRPTPKPKRPAPNPMLMAGAALEFGLLMIVCIGGGYWLDEKLDTSPVLTLTGLAVGLTGGIYNLYRLGKRFF